MFSKSLRLIHPIEMHQIVYRGWGLAGWPPSLLFTSSPKLIPTPGFLPPGYSLFSCVFPMLSSTWGNPAVGGGDNFWGSYFIIGHRQPAGSAGNRVRALLWKGSTTGARAGVYISGLSFLAVVYCFVWLFCFCVFSLFAYVCMLV